MFSEEVVAPFKYSADIFLMGLKTSMQTEYSNHRSIGYLFVLSFRFMLYSSAENKRFIVKAQKTLSSARLRRVKNYV
jgi:hypothetical protein